MGFWLCLFWGFSWVFGCEVRLFVVGVGFVMFWVGWFSGQRTVRWVGGSVWGSPLRFGFGASSVEVGLVGGSGT